MGTYYFGVEEKVRCIQDVSILGEGDEALCLAYKTSTKFYLAGLYVKDDGYVLGSKARPGIYYPLTDEDVATWQAKTLLPKPLPSYSLHLSDYVVGYSVWLCVGVLLLWLLVAPKLARLKDRIFRREVEDRRLKLKTKADLFVAEQARRELASGEVVEHQAYALDRFAEGLATLFAGAFFVVVTNKRVLFIRTRRGLLAPVLENRGVESVGRAEIVKVTRGSSGYIDFTLRDGSKRTVFLKKTLFGSLSNQEIFAAKVPILLRAESR